MNIKTFGAYLLYGLSGLLFMVFTTILNLSLYISHPHAHVVITVLLATIAITVFLLGDWKSRSLFLCGYALAILAGNTYLVDPVVGLVSMGSSVLVLATSLWNVWRKPREHAAS
jgi:hypothetical protein